MALAFQSRGQNSSIPWINPVSSGVRVSIARFLRWRGACLVTGAGSFFNIPSMTAVIFTCLRRPSPRSAAFGFRLRTYIYTDLLRTDRQSEAPQFSRDDLSARWWEESQR